MAPFSGPRLLGQGGFTAFVPNGDSRKETAILLVGTAREYGLDQRSVRMTSGGFYISDELAHILSEEMGEDEDVVITEGPAPEPVAALEAGPSADDVEETPAARADQSLLVEVEKVDEEPKRLPVKKSAAKKAAVKKAAAKKAASSNASGNRAAKNSTKDKE